MILTSYRENLNGSK